MFKCGYNIIDFRPKANFANSVTYINFLFVKKHCSNGTVRVYVNTLIKHSKEDQHTLIKRSRLGIIGGGEELNR